MAALIAVRLTNSLRNNLSSNEIDIIRRSLTVDEKAEVKVNVGRGLEEKLISEQDSLI